MTTAVQSATSASVRGRWLHPAAWWVWALGLATAASRTTNPVLLLLIIAVAATVVAARRPDAPWSRSFAVFLRIGLIVVTVRIAFQVLLGAPQGTTVLFTLPGVDLPTWMAGVRLGGQVTLESIVYAAYDGLRLATVIACLGAASSLASPYRLLKAMPAALYEVGVAMVVALSFAPAMVTDVQRVRTARRLRGRPTSGARGLAGAAMPVFSGALDHSIALAAAMDSRGYGRAAERSPRERHITNALVLGGLLGVCVGLYALLDGSNTSAAGLPLLLIGLGAAAFGFIRGGRRNVRSRYRPDPWLAPEWITALTGVIAVAGTFAQASIDQSALTPSISPLLWPQVPWIAALGVLVALLPVWLTPTPPAIVVLPPQTTGAP